MASSQHTVNRCAKPFPSFSLVDDANAFGLRSENRRFAIQFASPRISSTFPNYLVNDCFSFERKLFVSLKAFRANTDSRSVVTHWLDPRLRARVVRIRPLTWYNGDKLDHRICLRFELYGCKNGKDVKYFENSYFY